MKIRKDSLFYKFLFYADAPAYRSNEEAVITFVLRCLSMCFLMPILFFMGVMSGLMENKWPLFFWEGDMYQDPKKNERIECSPALKVIMFIMAILIFLGLFWVVFRLATLPISEELERLFWKIGQWVIKERQVVILLTAVAIWLWVFRKRLPKVEYMD
ncbi:MAG: hypothetical protein V1690_00835 [Candidatus Moraniibacteriota bacterium]